jgi:hypothetical protein
LSAECEWKANRKTGAINNADGPNRGCIENLLVYVDVTKDCTSTDGCIGSDLLLKDVIVYGVLGQQLLAEYAACNAQKENGLCKQKIPVFHVDFYD